MFRHFTLPSAVVFSLYLGMEKEETKCQVPTRELVVYYKGRLWSNPCEGFLMLACLFWTASICSVLCILSFTARGCWIGPAGNGVNVRVLGLFMTPGSIPSLIHLFCSVMLSFPIVLFFLLNLLFNCLAHPCCNFVSQKTSERVLARLAVV